MTARSILASIAFLAAAFYGSHAVTGGTAPDNPSLSAAPGKASPSRSGVMPLAWRLEGVDVIAGVPAKGHTGPLMLVGKERTVLGVEMANGRPLWEANAVLPPTASYRVGASSEYLVIATEGELVGVSLATGKRAWASSPPCQLSVVKVEGEVAIGQCMPSPKDKGCADSPLVAFDMRNGAVLWRHAPKEGVFGLHTDRSALFLIDFARRPPPGPHKGQLVALKLTSGHREWKVELDDAEAHLIVGEGTVVVAGSSLTAFSKTNGKRLWRRTTVSADRMEPAWSIAERGVVVGDSLVLPVRTTLDSYALLNGQAGKPVPYPTAWKSKAARRNATLYSAGSVLLAGTDDERGDSARDIYLRVGDEWVLAARLAEDTKIEFVVDGYVAVRSGRALETYAIPSTAREAAPTLRRGK